ncbi:MAG: MATE family efflux transporter [Clostridiales bacterium]|nr:MATE family efflux transporter [Clostridiales bacterium]
MKLARQEFDVTEGPLLKKTLLYTIPIILTSILQLLFNAADLIVVGSASELYVAAVGATNSITNLCVNLFIGLSSGVAVVTSTQIGARNYKGVQNAVHTTIPLALISGAFLSVVGILIATPVLTLMGTPTEILGYASTYMKIFFLGMIPNLIYNFGSAILRAAGDTKGPFYYLTIAGVINVILNLFFVKVLHMNVDGVAIATVISQLISAIFVINALIKRTDMCRLDLKSIRFEKQAFKDITNIGLPTGFQGVLFSIANVMVQSSVNTFGPMALAGNAASANVEGFGYVTIHSFYHSTITFIGQNMGAKKYDRIKKVFAVNVACVLGFGAVVGLFYGLLGRPLLALYNVTDQEGINFGLTRLAFIAVPYFVYGLSDITAGAIRAMGSPILPTINSIGGVCGLRLLMIFTVFKFFGTPESLFITYPISWGVTFITGVIIFMFVYKKIKKQATQEQ